MGELVGGGYTLLYVYYLVWYTDLGGRGVFRRLTSLLYRTPADHTTTQLLELEKSLEHINNMTRNNPNATIIVGGDFNAGDINWETNSVPSGAKQSTICSKVLDILSLFLPPSWRHAHAHFGFAHRQQPLRWLKPFLKHWYVKLYELIAPHTLKWINSVIKLGHFVWNIIYCLSRIKFKDRWVIFFIYDSFCWTKSPTAASLGSRNDAM